MNNREKIENEVIGNVVTIRPTDDGDPVEHDKGVKWPDPQPLTVKVPPEPYPLDALPEITGAAVREVVEFVQCPFALAASSALGALSIAIQGHVDVARAERLTSPTSLNLLGIGGSGERKSTVDSFFTSAIRAHEDEVAEQMKPEIKIYQAALDSWQAERDGILAAIRNASRDKKPVDRLKADLRDLEHDKPEAPRVPKFLLGDDTPEQQAFRLAKLYPCGGVCSAEAGIILGSHGMGADSIMRNLGQLNVLWDGGKLSVGRRTSESFDVYGARLTVALQIQEATLRSFFGKSGALARGTGFFARFLISWPESTQGSRMYKEAPTHWPALRRFNERIRAIMANPLPINEDGRLTPAMMALTPEAKSAWIEYHDAIERELASGGDLHEVNDVASKSADNAVRIAALFQLFEHGFGGAISLDCFVRASTIAAWHLYEARRFFGELALPVELANAARLDSWLVEYCRRVGVTEVPKNYARQHGALRDGAMLDAAIKELQALDRVRLVKDGRKIILRINPALMVQP